MNEFKRHEAYVRVRGLPFDVKIDGWARQSRSVHGDEVCVLIDPSEEWERVGGGDDGDDVCASVDVDADGGRRVSPWRRCVDAGGDRRVSSWRR